MFSLSLPLFFSLSPTISLVLPLSRDLSRSPSLPRPLSFSLILHFSLHREERRISLPDLSLYISLLRSLCFSLSLTIALSAMIALLSFSCFPFLLPLFPSLSISPPLFLPLSFSPSLFIPIALLLFSSLPSLHALLSLSHFHFLSLSPCISA